MMQNKIRANGTYAGKKDGVRGLLRESTCVPVCGVEKTKEAHEWTKGVEKILLNIVFQLGSKISLEARSPNM